MRPHAVSVPLAACVAVMVGANSCRGVAWPDEDPLHGMAWRDRTAFVGPAGGDVVFASSGAGAGEVVAAITALRTHLREELGIELGPGLIVAVDADDEPLIDEPRELVATLAELHAARTGRESRMPMDLDDLRTGPADDVDLTEEQRAKVVRAMVRLVPAAFDPGPSGLGLPAAAVQRTSWGFVYPTDECVEDSLWESIAAVLPLWQRSIALLAWGRIKGEMIADMTEPRRRMLAGLVLAEAGIDEQSERAADVWAVVDRIGLRPDDVSAPDDADAPGASTSDGGGSGRASTSERAK